MVRGRGIDVPPADTWGFPVFQNAPSGDATPNKPPNIPFDKIAARSCIIG